MYYARRTCGVRRPAARRFCPAGDRDITGQAFCCYEERGGIYAGGFFAFAACRVCVKRSSIFAKRKGVVFAHDGGTARLSGSRCRRNVEMGTTQARDRAWHQVCKMDVRAVEGEECIL